MKVLQFPSQYQPGETPYAIFKDRMSAIDSLVESIKGIIKNKYTKGFIDTTIGQLNKARTEQETTDMINLLTTDPSEEIYGDVGKIEDTAGKIIDTFNIAGKIMQKEKSMANIGGTGVLPQSIGTPSGSPTGTPSASSSEVMLPKGDKLQVLNAISKMPDGQMDYKPILDYMQKNRPGFMGSFSPEETWVMNQVLGQQVNPADKLVADVQKAGIVSDYFNDEPGTEWEWLRKDPQGYAEAMKFKQSLIAPEQTAWEVQLEHLIQARKDGFITD